MSSVSIRIPKGFNILNCSLTLWVGSGGAATRLRLLDRYSSPVYGDSSDHNAASVTLDISGISGQQTIYLQGLSERGGLMGCWKTDPYAMFIRM